MNHPAPLPAEYPVLLERLKKRITQAQVRAAFAVSRELLLLYWEIGRDLVERQEKAGWGDGVIRQLAADLLSAFPDTEGFSYRNLYRMRAFYQAYPDEAEFVTQPVSQIPWGHNIALFQKLKDRDARLWYAHQTLQNGWSRAILEHQIETHLIDRQGQAVTNFSQALPAPQSDLAQQALKDPYNFGFLALTASARERELEAGLRSHIREFLLELGTGFAFLGTQYPISVSGKDYYLDLLFYHVRLRCFIVIDLKMREFEPEFAGKMNFYLSAVDDLLRHASDNPSIGILLCKSRDRVTVEYALRRSASPIGVAEYVITEALPEDLQSSLPTSEALEEELESSPATEGNDSSED